jgi:hypothetical protein
VGLGSTHICQICLPRLECFIGERCQPGPNEQVFVLSSADQAYGCIIMVQVLATIRGLRDCRCDGRLPFMRKALSFYISSSQPHRCLK